MGAGEFAERCRAIAERGAKKIDAQLFNGEYYIQRPDAAHPRTCSGAACASKRWRCNCRRTCGLDACG